MPGTGQGREELQLVDTVEWVHLYAAPHAHTCLHLIASPLPKKQKADFINKHQRRKQNFWKHVQRVIEKKPLVSAGKLLELGIPEGKKVGVLLKEAERMAIIENIDDEVVLLEKLKSTPLWQS